MQKSLFPLVMVALRRPALTASSAPAILGIIPPLMVPSALLSVALLSACSKPAGDHYGSPERYDSPESYAPAATTQSGETGTAQDNFTLAGGASHDQANRAHLADRQFIVSASTRFGVDDVVKSVDAIEKLTLDTGGYIAKSHIYNETTEINNYPIGELQIKTLSRYIRYGDVIVRVPRERVSELLAAVQAQVVFLDEKEFDTTDIALELQRQALQAQIEAARQARLNKLDASKDDSLSDKADVIDDIAISEQIQALAELERQALADKVAFSTLSFRLYQDAQIHERITPDIHARINQDYQANFGQRLAVSLQDGWSYFLNIILLLANLWVFILVALVALVLFRKLWHRPLRRRPTNRQNPPPQPSPHKDDTPSGDV